MIHGGNDYYHKHGLSHVQPKEGKRLKTTQRGPAGAYSERWPHPRSPGGSSVRSRSVYHTCAMPPSSSGLHSSRGMEHWTQFNKQKER